jgi:hypothetical protein
MGRRVSRGLTALIACVAAGGLPFVLATPAVGEVAGPTVHILDPQPDTKIVSGVDATVAVDLGGSDSGVLLVELGPVSSQLPIGAGECAGGCTRSVHLSVPNGTWDDPVESGPIYLRATVTVPGADPVTEVYGLVLDGPARMVGFAVVRNGIEYRTDSPVLDGPASVLLEADERWHGDDVGQMRIVDGATAALIASGEAPWVADGAGYKAEIPFDVTSVPDGDYLLSVRSRTATGRWGHGFQRYIRVSHVNPVSITASPPYMIVGDAQLVANVTVRGAIPGGFRPGALRVSLDGVDRELASPSWSPYNWSLPGTEQTLQFVSPGGDLAPGTHQVTFQLLSTIGQPLGAALARTYTVSDFSGSVSVPRIQIVGQRFSGTAAAVAPIGYKFESCFVGQAVPARSTGQEIGSGWCVQPIAQFSTTFSFIPQDAGTGSATLVVLADGRYRQYSQPVTVYAARRVSVTAPALPYGTVGTARITVQDAKVLNQWQPAPSGVRVVLQRLIAGTTTWLTVGAAYTAAGGVATVPFTSFANGRFRVVAASSLPGQTITSPTIAAISTAIVSWRSAPTSAVRGRTYVYEAATRPYEPGAKAYLQVRPPGVLTWAGARTITLPSTGIARFSYAFNRTGYWRVRIVRAGTTLRTGTASSTVGVWVR